PAPTTSKHLVVCYRGLMVRRTKTDEGAWYKAIAGKRITFPDEYRVGVKAAKKDSAAGLLIKTASRQGARLVDDVQEVVSRGVALVPRLRGPADPTATIDRKQVEKAEIAVDVPYKPGTEPHETWWACGS